MVVIPSDREKQDFSNALKELLQDVPDRERTPLVARICKVTYQSAHKYLNGQSIPRRERIRMLIKHIGPRGAILLGGANVRDIKIGDDDDPLGQKLTTIWGSLNEEVKGQIVAFALISAATLPVPKDPEPQGIGAQKKTSPPGK